MALAPLGRVEKYLTINNLEPARLRGDSKAIAKIAGELGLSAAAVRRYVDQLLATGFELRAVPRGGPESSPDSPAEVRVPQRLAIDYSDPGNAFPFGDFVREVSQGAKLSGRAPTSGPRAETAGIDGVIAGNEFRTTRDLMEYVNDFGPWLTSALSSLKGSDRILEGGAGDGFFAEDLITLTDRNPEALAKSLVTNRSAYQWTPLFFSALPDESRVASRTAPWGIEPGKMQRHVYEELEKTFDRIPASQRPFLKAWADRPQQDRPQVTAVTYALNARQDSDFAPVRQKAPGKLDLITGSFFGDLPDARLLGGSGQKFRLYVDNKGVFTYTRTPSSDLQKVLDLTTPDATMLFTMGSNTFVEVAPGKSLSFGDWLKSIPGLRVEVETRNFAGDHSGRSFEHTVIRVRKEPGAKITVPTIELVSAEGENAPARQFRQVS